MTTLPADPIALTGQVIANAYSHLGDVVQLATGHKVIRAPKHVPAILWRSNRDVPILSASRVWARISVSVVTYAHEGYLVLDPEDLREDAPRVRVHPGYLDPVHEGLMFRIRQRPEEPKLSRECGLYRARHLWQVSLRVKSGD